MGGEWRYWSLDECLAALIDYRGKTPVKTASGVPLITAKVVKAGRIESPDEFIAEEEYATWMRRGIPQAGDVVLTTEAPLGEVAQLDGRKVALAQRLVALRGKPDVVDNTFLKYLLQSHEVQSQLKSRATGTTVLGIKQSELRKVVLLLPSLAEQRAIAHILGTLDDKIELNRRMGETLEAIARALFKAWFVDEHRDDGSLPSAWTSGPLAEFCAAIFSGGTPSTGRPEFWGGTLPWLSSGETRAKFITETEKTITDAGVAQSSTRFARSGSTVIASAGQGSTRGQTSLLMLDSYVNQSVVVVQANLQRSSDLFVFFDLERRYEQFRRLSDAHSSRGSLTTRLLGDLEVAMPPKDLVDAFDSRVSPLVSRIKAAKIESRALAALRDTLLPKLISGELRVKDAERFVEAAV